MLVLTVAVEPLPCLVLLMLQYQHNSDLCLQLHLHSESALFRISLVVTPAAAAADVLGTCTTCEVGPVFTLAIPSSILSHLAMVDELTGL